MLASAIDLLSGKRTADEALIDENLMEQDTLGNPATQETRKPEGQPRRGADRAAKRAVVDAAWSRALWRGDEEAPRAVGLTALSSSCRQGLGH